MSTVTDSFQSKSGTNSDIVIASLLLQIIVPERLNLLGVRSWSLIYYLCAQEIKFCRSNKKSESDLS